PAGGPTSGKGAVATLSVGGNGQMTLQKQADTSAGFPGDEALSHDDKYLYVSVPSIIVPGGSHMEVYKLASGASMTRIQRVPSPDPSTYPPAFPGTGAFGASKRSREPTLGAAASAAAPTSLSRSLSARVASGRRFS